ncbi:MAG: cyclic nucleotide-binding domain-containing protein [bacterium]|nr:cyclic nucleotide-binding domain-containing protein [bacterium]
MDVRGLLEGARLLKGMSESQITAIGNLAQKVHFSRGEKIILEDGRDRDFYIVAEGKVSITLFVPGSLDRMESIISLRAGQIFGEFAVIDGAPRSASVQADTEVAVFRFHAEDVIKLCETDFEFGYRLMHNLGAILASRIRDTTLLVRNNIIW